MAHFIYFENGTFIDLNEVSGGHFSVTNQEITLFFKNTHGTVKIGGESARMAKKLIDELSETPHQILHAIEMSKKEKEEHKTLVREFVAELKKHTAAKQSVS